MITRNRKIVWLFLILSWVSTSAMIVPETVEDNKGKVLFKIERSRDPDEIWYTINLNQNGSLNQDMPVKAFWVRKNENNKIEPLTRIQKRFGYGIRSLDSENSRDNEWHFQLAAYKNQIFILKRSADLHYRVFTLSGSKEIEVERIFVEFDGGSFLTPNIAEVKLTGVNLKTGKEITEILNSRK